MVAQRQMSPWLFIPMICAGGCLGVIFLLFALGTAVWNSQPPPDPQGVVLNQKDVLWTDGKMSRIHCTTCQGAGIIREFTIQRALVTCPACKGTGEQMIETRHLTVVSD